MILLIFLPDGIAFRQGLRKRHCRLAEGLRRSG
jgi:hypothetical protein